MYKFGTKLFAAAVSVLLFCGCTEIEEETPAPVTEATTTAPNPYPVEAGSLVFSNAPESVGSLSPAITEIICELGFSDKIIGRSNYCNYPENISDRTELGSAANPDVNAVIETAPDLLISMSPIAKKDITVIEAKDIRVWIISQPESINDLYGCYSDVAAVFGGGINSDAAAEDALEPLKKALNDAENSMESFVYIMSPELAVASDSTFAGDFFSCFGENAAGNAEDISISTEDLLNLDPEWIILPEQVDTDELPEEISELSALENGRVIVLNEETLERIERPTSRLDSVVYDILEQIEAGGIGASEKSDEDAQEDE